MLSMPRRDSALVIPVSVRLMAFSFSSTTKSSGSFIFEAMFANFTYKSPAAPMFEEMMSGVLASSMRIESISSTIA